MVKDIKNVGVATAKARKPVRAAVAMEAKLVLFAEDRAKERLIWHAPIVLAKEPKIV